jgi:nitroimidazol reductase NimA-like FMN-containing flavoprotein (pyridoxamine 5'-phosphate oxidase superfamily)
MTNLEPITEQLPSSIDHPAPAAWAEARQLLAEGEWYWLATTRPDGRPHVMPLLAVWMDNALYFVAGAMTRKARNLAENSHCVIAVATEDAHLVVEGKAKKVTDEALLHHVAGVYASKYEWPVTVREGAFYGDGAPTAGPAPYEVYEVKPIVVFGFGTDEKFSPTRWRF